jgi:hypothetical protein
MRGIPLLAALTGVLGLALLAAGESATGDGTARRVERLVGQLGSSRFAEREKAQRELEGIGPPALERLRKATTDADLETSRRAGELVQKIEHAVLAAKLLTPTRVRLAFNNTPVSAAIADLARQSGYRIYLSGDKAALRDRKVTFTTGEVSFWEAFDTLCHRARLVEVSQTAGAGAAVPRAGRDPFSRRLPPPGFAQPVDEIADEPAQFHFVVKDGKPVAFPTCYAGSMRIRALTSAAANLPRNPGEAAVVLELAPEPHLEQVAIDVGPALRKVCDDQGQTLSVASSTAYGSPSRRVLIRFKIGEKHAQALKTVQGLLTVKLLTPPQPIITVDKVEKAAGQTYKNREGGSLQVLAYDLQPNRDVQIRVRMTNLAGDNPLGGALPGGRVQIQQVQGQQVMIQVVGVNGRRRFVTSTSYQGRLPSLLDANGKNYSLYHVPQRRVQATNGELMEEVTLSFRPHEGQGPPARLVVNGQRPVAIPVSFNLTDVPLP